MRDSRVEVVRFVFPQHLNPRGKLYGGTMIRWVLEAGMLAAQKHARLPVVLAGMEHLFFLAPVSQGEVVTFYGQVDFAGRTSMEVSVEVISEDPIRGTRRRPCLAYLTFVALRGGRPAAVPPLEPEFRSEDLAYREAELRRKEREPRIRDRKARRVDVRVPIPEGTPHTLVAYREIFPEWAVAEDIADAGEVLAYLDGLGGIVARRFARRVPVTVALDAVSFYEPLRVGDLMVVYCALNYVGRHAMEVGMKVLRERPETGERFHVCTAYYTYVAVDEAGRVTEVPEYEPATPEARKRYEEGARRQALRRQRAEALKRGLLIPEGRPPGASDRPTTP